MWTNRESAMLNSHKLPSSVDATLLFFANGQSCGKRMSVCELAIMREMRTEAEAATRTEFEVPG
jgi:hypothetical protein